MKTTIYLIRHGTTDWNEAGRYQGSSDIPLNQKGLEESKKTGESLSKIPFNAIYSSPLIRARKTAEEIARHHSLPIVFVEELKERSYGLMEGLSFKEIEHHPHFKKNTGKNWYLLGSPDGESFKDASRRVDRAFSNIVYKHPRESIAIVAHGGVIKSVGFNIGYFNLKNISKVLIPNAHPIIIEYSHIEKGYTVVDFSFTIK
ncbi:MAG TPA: histidine phosphatase family protein [Patescibacteria group bacterium]|nr:histidine phosphatase family protein [Patescibacteria group bacterium]